MKLLRMRSRLRDEAETRIPCSRRRARSVSLSPSAAGGIGASAVGAFAAGAMAVGALAIGAVAVGRLVVGRARIRRLEIDELVVRNLHVTDQLTTPTPALPAVDAASTTAR